MKKIKAIESWKNGILVSADNFDLFAVTDNLKDYATFSYSIQTDDGLIIDASTIIMDGQDYQDWSTNDYAWQWAASKLNLELI